MSYGAHTHWLFCLNRVTQPGDSKDQSSRSFSWYRKQTAIATAPLCVLFPAPPPPPYRNVFFLTTGPDSSSSSSSIPSSSYSSSFLSLSIVEALCDLPFSYRLEKTIYPTRLPFTHNTSLTQYPSSCKPRPGRHMNWSSRIYQSEPALILLMRPLYNPPTTLPPSRQKTTDSYFGLPRLIEPHCVFFLYLQGWGRCACGGALEDWTFVRRGFMAPNVFWKIKTVV